MADEVEAPNGAEPQQCERKCNEMTRRHWAERVLEERRDNAEEGEAKQRGRGSGAQPGRSRQYIWLVGGKPGHGQRPRQGRHAAVVARHDHAIDDEFTCVGRNYTVDSRTHRLERRR